MPGSTAPCKLQHLIKKTLSAQIASAGEAPRLGIVVAAAAAEKVPDSAWHSGPEMLLFRGLVVTASPGHSQLCLLLAAWAWTCEGFPAGVVLAQVLAGWFLLIFGVGA